MISLVLLKLNVIFHAMCKRNCKHLWHMWDDQKKKKEGLKIKLRIYIYVKKVLKWYIYARYLYIMIKEINPFLNIKKNPSET